MGEYIHHPKKAGIYKLICRVNGKIYVGKTVNLRKRLYDHKNSENLENVNNFVIHKAIKKYGWDSFDVEILEIIEDFDKHRDKQKILNIESHYINLLESTNPERGYNICKFSTDRTGLFHSEETKQKISAANKGRKLSKESIEKMRMTKTGVPHKGHSPEALEKMRQSKLGKKRPEFSKEWRENIGKGHRGLKMSEEAKQKISEAHKGKPKSEEAVEKMRQSRIGSKATEETKRKMSESRKGKKISEKQKQILIECNKNRVITEQIRKNMSNAQKGNKNASGRRSEEVKQRMRESRLAYLQKQKESKSEIRYIETMLD